MKRFILILTLTALAACGKKEPATASAREAPPLPADVQKVQGAVTNTMASTSGDATDTPATAPAAGETGGAIVATGELVSPVRSELAAKMPGRVGKIYVDEGVRVSRGQPLLELESDYARLNAERADADVARARATNRSPTRCSVHLSTESSPRSAPMSVNDWATTPWPWSSSRLLLSSSVSAFPSAISPRCTRGRA